MVFIDLFLKIFPQPPRLVSRPANNSPYPPRNLQEYYDKLLNTPFKRSQHEHLD